jgi:hypothetical protein
MPITAVVLLRGTVKPDGVATVALDDATLVPTSIRFDLEPADLAAALGRKLGAALDAATDPRGVFVLPDVALDAAKDAKTYDAALAAVADGGSWIKLRADAATDTMEDRALGMDDILAQAMSGRPVDPAMLASLLGGLPSHDDDDDDDDDDGTRTAIDDEDDDDPSATETDLPIDLAALMGSPVIQQLMGQMAEALAKSPEAQRELAGSGKDGALDLEALSKSPAIQKLIEGFGQSLGNDPAALASLLGAPPDDDDE